MAGSIWELFGYAADDRSVAASNAAAQQRCPFLQDFCEKRLSDGLKSGVCSIKPETSGPVICCPVRLYADEYRVLRDVAEKAFGSDLSLVAGRDAVSAAQNSATPVVAVFGKRWGKELRLPQKGGTGGYFVDWVLALLDPKGTLQEFVAVEVQTIDTTGNYRNGREALLAAGRINEKTSVGLNWENVSKRILPQLIYKGQVLQREALCRKGLFFICPGPVYDRIMRRLGGASDLVRYALQPSSITFMPYVHEFDAMVLGQTIPLKPLQPHSTTIYKLQEAFNNVTLPDENVFRDAIIAALSK